MQERDCDTEAGRNVQEREGLLAPAEPDTPAEPDSLPTQSLPKAWQNLPTQSLPKLADAKLAETCGKLAQNSPKLETCRNVCVDVVGKCRSEDLQSTEGLYGSVPPK